MNPLLQAGLAAIALFCTSCAVFQKDAPVASIEVAASSSEEVEAATIGAFQTRGFRVTSREEDTVTIERPAGKMDQVLYSNWNEEQLAERVVVRISPAKPGFFNVACLPFAVRGRSDSGIDDPQRRFALFSPQYSTILREARRTLASGSGR